MGFVGGLVGRIFYHLPPASGPATADDFLGINTPRRSVILPHHYQFDHVRSMLLFFLRRLVFLAQVKKVFGLFELLKPFETSDMAR
jgi:hypothetical protein